MKEWIIKDYKDTAVDWAKVPALEINEYPWYEGGLKQETKAQLAIYQDRIYIHAKAQDKYIRHDAKELNDPVYEDSCFEFFVTPWDHKSQSYFNIEINCMGVLYMAYKDGKGGKKMISKEQSRQISIKSSLKESKDIDKESGWELEIIIPIGLLEEISEKEIKKDVWYGNFYRCGGKEDDQYASWNPIEFEKPSFHQPMQFGRLIIQE
ncbi:MAG: hypothetical protein GX366_02495 [Epulopiscium sp.]|nr:hypothetical protein [Candidatus Epulonipiscium sp.]